MPTPKRKITRVYVDSDLKAKFLAQYPMPGALSWVTEIAMQAVVNITDGTPALQSLIASSIVATLLEHKLQHRRVPSEQPDTAAGRRTDVAYTATVESVL